MKTAIIARTNAVLVTAAFDLIKRGCQIQIIGKDVAKQLKEAIGDIVETRRRCTIEEFRILLSTWMDQIRNRLDKDRAMSDEAKEDVLADAEEKHGCLQVMAANAISLEDILAKIDNYFVDSGAITDDPSVITLVTAHRSKGDEFDRVIVLRSDLFPHPRAKREEDLIQEENGWYVTCTRARKELIICADSKPE